jgi:hypothetical protein
MTPVIQELSVQEHALAAAMVHKVGNATLGFVLDQYGAPQHLIPKLTETNLTWLVRDFARDPKETLAWARESLFAINTDTRLSATVRRERLSRYIDAYSDLTIKLDHAAFPNTQPGVVQSGVPEYIPDGFVDMGRSRTTDPTHRDREQILVDKRAILTKYKPLLTEIFMTDYSAVTLGQKKRDMADKIAQAVYFSMPYSTEAADNLGGGLVPLSQLSEGVCRHQGMVFQVLGQAVGLKMRQMKALLGNVYHSTDVMRIDGRWFLYDVTNPDYVINRGGEKEWRPGVYPIDGPPPRGAKKTYQVKAKHSGEEHTYIAHDDMFWFIEHPSR